MNDVLRQVRSLDAICGKRGTHADLAREVRTLGLCVEPDVHDGERSVIRLHGCWDADGHLVAVGMIIGDRDAVIVSD